MRAAVVENGVVANVIEVDSLDALPGLIPGDGAAIGDAWDGQQFIRPAVVPPLVPERVPMLNAHLVLIDAGWMPALREYLDAMPGTEGEKARAYFVQALTLARDHDLVRSIPAALGKTEAEVDALFIAAGDLDV